MHHIKSFIPAAATPRPVHGDTFSVSLGACHREGLEETGQDNPYSSSLICKMRQPIYRSPLEVLQTMAILTQGMHQL